MSAVFGMNIIDCSYIELKYCPLFSFIATAVNCLATILDTSTVVAVPFMLMFPKFIKHSFVPDFNGMNYESHNRRIGTSFASVFVL